MIIQNGVVQAMPFLFCVTLIYVDGSIYCVIKYEKQGENYDRYKKVRH